MIARVQPKASGGWVVIEGGRLVAYMDSLWLEGARFRVFRRLWTGGTVNHAWVTGRRRERAPALLPSMRDERVRYDRSRGLFYVDGAPRTIVERAAWVECHVDGSMWGWGLTVRLTR